MWGRKGFRTRHSELSYIALAMILSSCDLSFLTFGFEKDIIQTKMEKSEIIAGDRPFSDQKLKSICIVHTNDYLSKYLPKDIINKHEVSGSSEMFFFIVRKDIFDTYSVNWVHESWMEIDGGDSICTDSPRKIVIKEQESDGWEFTLEN